MNRSPEKRKAHSEQVSKVHVVLSEADSYRDVVDPLVSAGAALHVLGNSVKQEGKRFRGKGEILRAMFSPRLLRLRHCWRSVDRVLLIGWQAIPILAMIKIGLIERPQKTLVMGCFVHGGTARNILNKLLKYLKFNGLGFVVFSHGEAENLINNVGVPQPSVYFHLWRQDLDGKVAPQDVTEGDYVFSGGYSNRDYDLLIAAMQGLNSKLVIVASSRNEIMTAQGVHATIHRDLDASSFEKLLAQSKLVVLPLRNQGEACGQSVLLRVLRNAKPLIVTRHESIEDYLGADYPGFVRAGDINDMQSMIRLVLENQDVRNELAFRVTKAAELLEKRDSPAQELIGFLSD